MQPVAPPAPLTLPSGASSCPLCTSPKVFILQRTRPLAANDSLVLSTLAAAGQALEFRGCLGCGLLFRTPRPTPEHLEHYYKDLLPPREPAIMASLGVTREVADKRNDRRYAEVYASVQRKAGRAKGHVVDVGGWDGRSLIPWQRKGWQVTLVEPGCETRAMASTSIRAVSTAQQALDLSVPKATIITSYHCVEHVLDLQAWLKDTRRLSQPGTLWVIEVPFEVIYIRGLLASEPMQAPYIHDEHLNFFTPRSLRSLGRRLGLEAISVNIVVTQYWFGPTVALRLYGRDAGRTPSLINHEQCFPSAQSMRRYLSWRMLAWKRWAGLRYRAYRWLSTSNTNGLAH